MIETNKLIYIQMQKTGCTRIGEIITQLCEGQPVGRKHGTLLKKPDKFVIGSIRNPWAWYVSLWAFGCEGRGGVRSWFKDDPDWHRVYSEIGNPFYFQQWLRMVYSEKYVSQMRNGYNQFNLAPAVGLMTWRYAYLYLVGIDYIDSVPQFANYDDFAQYEKQFNMADYFVRLETVKGGSMAGNLHFALCAAGYKIERPDIARLCQKKSNISNHQPYQKYYDQASLELVREHEKLVVEKFGYSFDE